MFEKPIFNIKLVNLIEATNDFNKGTMYKEILLDGSLL